MTINNKGIQGKRMNNDLCAYQTDGLCLAPERCCYLLKKMSEYTRACKQKGCRDRTGYIKRYCKDHTQSLEYLLYYHSVTCLYFDEAPKESNE